MSTPTTPLDLGNIAKIGLDEEVVSVELKGRRLVIGPVRIVYRIDENRVLIRRPGGSTVGGFQPNGKSFPGIYPNDIWFSANPKHIERSKKQAIAAQLKIDIAKRKREALIARAMPIAELLAYDESREVAESLAQRLSTDQLKTLAEWLGL